MAWRRKRQPAPVLLSGKFHGLRSLAGYSPQGCKESDMTEHVCMHMIFIFAIIGGKGVGSSTQNYKHTKDQIY